MALGFYRVILMVEEEGNLNCHVGVVGRSGQEGLRFSVVSSPSHQSSLKMSNETMA